MSDDSEAILAHGSLRQIRQMFAHRKLSVVEAVRYYLARVETLNAAGPALNAVRIVSPDLHEQAARADADIRAGRNLGALHGIPVLLKDNILTGEGMPAAAGAAALAEFRPRRDATLAVRLRRAGAIIFGKANMTEFADYVSDVMPSGFSGAGGMVRNPHGGEYGRGLGSSVGSAAAVAAGMVPVAIGSETQNSIQTPACVSSVYGYKPSVGMVSRAGMVPLVPSQDTAGTLARSIEDAALVSSILCGFDPADTCTFEAPAGLAAELRPRDLRSVRIGIPRATISDRPDLAHLMPQFEAVIAKLAAAGAQIFYPCDAPSAEQLRDVRSSVFKTEFKAAIDAFLAAHRCHPDIASLSDLIRWNEAHPHGIPFGQSLLLTANSTNGLDDPGYRADRRRDIALSRTAGIDAALEAADADILMVPMGSAAKWTGKAGAPVLAVPAGLDDRHMPFGVTIIASRWQDRDLLEIGAAIAAEIGDRRAPSLSLAR